MKYIIMDYADGDCFTDEFEDKDYDGDIVKRWK